MLNERAAVAVFSWSAAFPRQLSKSPNKLVRCSEMRWEFWRRNNLFWTGFSIFVASVDGKQWSIQMTWSEMPRSHWTINKPRRYQVLLSLRVYVQMTFILNLHLKSYGDGHNWAEWRIHCEYFIVYKDPKTFSELVLVRRKQNFVDLIEDP